VTIEHSKRLEQSRASGERRPLQQLLRLVAREVVRRLKVEQTKLDESAKDRQG
jgi:hypothetical protein